MVGYPRLRYSNTIPFPLRTTLLGHLLILLALTAALIGTLLTKGRVYPTQVHYLSKENATGYDCNSTLIYPGQPFGGDPTNSSFIWVTQNSFSYFDQTFDTCTVRRTSSWDGLVTAGSIHVSFRYTVDCSLPPGQTASFQASLESEVTNPALQLIDSAKSDFLDNFPDSLGWAPLEGTDAQLNYFEYDQLDQSFRVILVNSSSWTWDTTDDNFRETLAWRMLANVTDAVNQDFNANRTVDIGTGVNPLPGVLYPCTETRKVWASTWTIIWECYTSLAATFSPVLTIITWLLLRSSGSPETRPAAEGVQEGSSQAGMRSSGYMRSDQDREKEPLALPARVGR